MQRLLDVLRALALATTVGVGAALFLVLLQVSSAVKRADRALSGAAAGLNGLDEQAGLLLGQTRESMVQVQRTVLLSGKLINDARLSADNLNRAALDERRYFEQDLPPAMDQVQGILANAQQATAALKGTAMAATGALDTADGVLTASQPRVEALLGDLDATTRHLDALAGSPAVAATLANVDRSTQNLAAASAQAAAILADGRAEADKYVHPPKRKLGFWGATEAAGDWLRHFLPPLF